METSESHHQTLSDKKPIVDSYGKYVEYSQSKHQKPHIISKKEYEEKVKWATMNLSSMRKKDSNPYIVYRMGSVLTKFTLQEEELLVAFMTKEEFDKRFF